MSRFRGVVVALMTVLLYAAPAGAQITTGTVAGTVKDAQGGVIPGATVVLVNDARGNKSSPAITNSSGDFVVPNLTAGTYTMEVTMPSFKTLRSELPLWLPLSAILGWIVFRELRWREKHAKEADVDNEAVPQ